jgi:hypothetical protein
MIISLHFTHIRHHVLVSVSLTNFGVDYQQCAVCGTHPRQSFLENMEAGLRFDVSRKAERDPRCGREVGRARWKAKKDAQRRKRNRVRRARREAREGAKTETDTRSPRNPV